MELLSPPRNAADLPVLANHNLFRTTELEEARDRVSRVFCEHDLRLVGKGQRVEAEMYYRKIRGIGLGRMRYGANVSVDSGKFETFALIQMPTSGVETVEHGKHTVCSNSRIATVLSPSLPLKLQHDAGTEKLIIRIDRDVLERHCRQLVGGDLRQPVEFTPRMDLNQSRYASWRRLMRWLYQEFGQDAQDDNEMINAPLFAAQVEQMVITNLLLTQPHNYSERLAGDGPSVTPHFVKRAESFIESNAHEPLTIGEIAEHVGGSTRSLFSGFRKYRNTTPMEYLKSVQIEGQSGASHNQTNRG